MPEWDWRFCSEIEPFPSAVLAHHYPHVPNHGDMTKFREWPDAAIDVLIGGTPCQSFSVAGLRKGLDDPRGNLALTFLAVADRYRPEWLVWENVPGVLSSNSGRDLGAFLGGLGELGYGWAYRCLDAQWFGLAQRRKRVFVVGHLGDWRRAAAVLFEPKGLRGDSPPRRDAGEGVAHDIAPCIGGNGRGGERTGDPRGQDAVVAFGGNNTAGPIDVATAVNAHGGPYGRIDFESETFVAHTLRGEGFDAGEDGTGRGTPLVPVPFDTTQITSSANYSKPKAGDPCHPLASGAHPPAVAYRTSGNCGAWETGDKTDALTTPNEGEPAPSPFAVRRLTPREAERLQGFPDDYTLITYRGKPAADGPRYKALGNSMAVPVVCWILRRIELMVSVDAKAAAPAPHPIDGKAIFLLPSQGHRQRANPSTQCRMSGAGGQMPNAERPA